MDDLYKPTEDDLKPLIDKVGDLVKWKPKFINSAIGFLQINPLQYRGYGPYWWLLKKAIIENGETGFGDFLDVEMIEALSYDDSTLNLFAAFVYNSEMFDLGKATSSNHALSLKTGDSIDYVIADDVMEMLHATNMI